MTEIDARFGVCPCCRKYDGYAAIGRDAWFVCDVHRLRWSVARDLRGDLATATNVAVEERAEYDVIEPVYPAHAHPLFLTHRDNKQAATVMRQGGAGKRQFEIAQPKQRRWPGRKAVPSPRSNKQRNDPVAGPS